MTKDQLPDIDALPHPREADNIVHNPTQDQMRAFSRELEEPTEYASSSYVSEYRSRSSERTWNTIDMDGPVDGDASIPEALGAAGATILDEIEERELVAVDVRVGADTGDAAVGRYIVPQEYARIARSLTNLMEPVEDAEPDFYTVQLPDADDTEIITDPDSGGTLVRGSDYTGEAKKSFLRQFMYDAKEQGGLGIHAGSKRVVIEDDDGLEEVGQVYQGLSGTGKSTLTAHGFWLDDPEHAEMLQDDVCALMPDGSVRGSEGAGLYIKTDGLDPDEQPELYDVATAGDAVLENVVVDEDGSVDFHDTDLTANGRAAVRRDGLDSAADDIDLDSVDQYFFITRNPLMPPAARLDDAQAAATFMLGESIETAAGDPSRAGERVRVVGVNPFIMGPEGEEGNRFHELIADNGVETYLINTGSVGGNDIGVEDTIGLLEAITRGAVDWQEDEMTGLDVPDSVPGVELDGFRPEDEVEDYEQRLRELQEERAEYLAGFDDLDAVIRGAVY